MNIKLKKLNIENYKKITVSEDIPGDAKSVNVSGRNGAGKSSFIDALSLSLGGKGVPKDPIKVGEDYAKIESELIQTINGEEVPFKTLMEFKRDGEKIKTSFTLFLNGKKSKGNTAKDKLDDLINNTFFDIFEFGDLTAGEQKKFILKLFRLEEEFDKLDSDRQAQQDLITQTKKQIESIKISYSEFKGIDESEEVLYIDPSELIQKQQEVGDIKIKKDAALNETTNAEIKLKDGVSKLAGLEQELAQLKAAQKALEESIEAQRDVITKTGNLRDELHKKYEAITVPELDAAEELEKIKENNIKFEALKKVKELKKQELKENNKILDATEVKNSIDKQKVAKLNEAVTKFGLDGLGFNENGLTYEGLSVSEAQLSKAQLMELGVKISLATKPNLKIARIKDASLMDSDTKKRVDDLADKYGLLVFYEMVNDCDLSITYEE
ncbi:hypothetical protein [Prochlorococcus sp. ALOHA_ZT_50]|uniref:hypothetical protein n=1 Tax=Prochlorococcus sp. ALOHA_ZT_50 TaxID=2919303 RepID=UPI00257C8EDA|nr:hypothetical protein [Prochlorococcus sp. ALOHA_ZT_50]MCH2079610.1 hypothetical protein [Prochlorococcus sp. ALOHA_ZT_50]